MDTTLVIAGVLAIVAACAFAVYRGWIRLSLRAGGGELTLEGKNPAGMPAGVNALGVRVGNDLTVQSFASGGVDASHADVKGNVSLSHAPENSPPKH